MSEPWRCVNGIGQLRRWEPPARRRSSASLTPRTLKLAAAARPLSVLADGSVAAWTASAGVVAADDQSVRTLGTFPAVAAHSARVVNAAASS